MVEVDLDELDATAEALSRSAGALGAVDLTTPVEAVPTQLPGAATAVAALGAVTRLGAAVALFGERVTEMSTASASCARNYRASDEASAARLTELLRS